MLPYTKVIAGASTNVTTPTNGEFDQGNNTLTPYNSAINNGYYRQMSQGVFDLSAEIENVITTAGLTPSSSLTQLLAGLDILYPRANTLGTASIKNTGTTSGTIPLIGTQSATTTLAGLTALADNTTTQTGTSATTAVTPASLKASSFGLGQTWQDVTGSRAITTTYTNSTGRPIEVSILVSLGNTGTLTNLTIGGVVACSTTAPGGGTYLYNLIGIVPNGATYSVSGGSPTLSRWSELR